MDSVLPVQTPQGTGQDALLFWTSPEIPGAWRVLQPPSLHPVGLCGASEAQHRHGLQVPVGTDVWSSQMC